LQILQRKKSLIFNHVPLMSLVYIYEFPNFVLFIHTSIPLLQHIECKGQYLFAMNVSLATTSSEALLMVSSSSERISFKLWRYTFSLNVNAGEIESGICSCLLCSLEASFLSCNAQWTFLTPFFSRGFQIHYVESIHRYISIMYWVR